MSICTAGSAAAVVVGAVAITPGKDRLPRPLPARKPSFAKTLLEEASAEEKASIMRAFAESGVARLALV